jgi:hypothetical protein
MIRQQHRRISDKVSDKIEVVDFSAVPDEEDGKTANEMRAELALLLEKERVERERLGGLLEGCGRGGGKAPEFEFAAVLGPGRERKFTCGRETFFIAPIVRKV